MTRGGRWDLLSKLLLNVWFNNIMFGGRGNVVRIPGSRAEQETGYGKIFGLSTLRSITV